MSTVTRAWTRRSAPVRRRSAGTFTSRRRRSLPRLVIVRAMSWFVGRSLLDIDRPELNPIVAVARPGGDLEPLPLAPRPEAHVDRVPAGGRRHQRDVGLEVIAYVFARKPEGGSEHAIDGVVVADHARRRRPVEMQEDLVGAG